MKSIHPLSFSREDSFAFIQQEYRSIKIYERKKALCGTNTYSKWRAFCMKQTFFFVPVLVADVLRKYTNVLLAGIHTYSIQSHSQTHHTYIIVIILIIIIVYCKYINKSTFNTALLGRLRLVYVRQRPTLIAFENLLKYFECFGFASACLE